MKLRKRTNSSINISFPKKEKSEPMWGNRLPTLDEYYSALAYYRETYKEKDLIDFLYEYLKKENRTKEAWVVKNSIPWRVSSTVCAAARIMFNGNLMPDDSLKFMNNHLEELKGKIED